MVLRNLAVLSMVAGLAAFGAGCGDPCVDNCEAANECDGATAVNCDTACQDAADDAETLGCTSERDDVLSCFGDQDDICAITVDTCSTELTALANCAIDACTADPTLAPCTA